MTAVRLINTFERSCSAYIPSMSGKLDVKVVSYIHTYRYTHTYIHTHIHTYIYTYIHTHIHTYIYIHHK